MVELFAERLVNTVLIGSNSTRVVRRIRIFSSLARELVGKLLC